MSLDQVKPSLRKNVFFLKKTRKYEKPYKLQNLIKTAIINFIKQKMWCLYYSYEPSGKISTWPKNLTGNTTSCLGISQGLNF